jgi:hypothetical protein
MPRYTVPLTWKGKLMLGLKLHRNPSDYVPDAAMKMMLAARAKWTQIRFGGQKK